MTISNVSLAPHASTSGHTRILSNVPRTPPPYAPVHDTMVRTAATRPAGQHAAGGGDGGGARGLGGMLGGLLQGIAGMFSGMGGKKGAWIGGILNVVGGLLQSFLGMLGKGHEGGPSSANEGGRPAVRPPRQTVPGGQPTTPPVANPANPYDPNRPYQP